MRKLFLALCLGLPAIAADIYTFDVPAPSTVNTPAGSVTGWGYSIQNQSDALWLVTSGLNAGSFQYATPTLLFDFPEIAPGATVTVPFDALSGTGLFQIAWNSAVPPGYVDYGTFNLTAQWWNGDPLNGGSRVSTAPNASVPYAASLTPIPEPATVGAVASAFALLWMGKLLHRRAIRR